MDKLLNLLNIEKKEVDKLVPLFFFSFFSGVFISIYFSISNSEFVYAYGKDILPIGYLLSGMVGYAAVLAYSRIIKKWPGYKSFMGGLSFLIAVTVLLLICLAFMQGTALNVLRFVIFLFAMPFVSVLGLVQTGMLLNTFNIQESKKYTGIISSGSTVASILGYFSIPLFSPLVNSSYDFFYIALAGLITSICFLIKINKRNGDRENPKPDKQAPSGSILLKNLLQQKYIRLIAVCGGISMIAFYFVDFSFMLNLQTKYANKPKALSAFIGGFFGLIKTGELLISLFSGRIFRLMGLKTGIVILPLTCMLFSLLLLFVHFSVTSAAPVFFFFVLMLKFLERVFRKAIEEPTFKALYQPLPATDRLSIQARIDGGTKQLFIILASLLLILSNVFMNNINVELLFLVLPIYSIWLLSSFKLVKAFKEKLGEILNSQNTATTATEKNIYTALSPLFKNDKGIDVLDCFFSPVRNEAVPLLQTPVANEETKFDSELNLFVPHPKLNYLKHGAGYSRLELQVDKPLLIIPHLNESKFKSSILNFETYNDTELLKMAMQGGVLDEPSKKKLGQTINLSSFCHEKKMALDILSQSGDDLTLSVLFEHLSYPDYFIRKQVYHSIEACGYKYREQEEARFQNALDNTISAIGFVYSVLAVVPNAANFVDLIKALKEEELLLKDQLLSILSWKYDSHSIQVLREVLISKRTDAASNIIALELIDNLLDAYSKQKIAEVFNNTTYTSRVGALSKWYYLSKITFKESLVELLNYDYCLIGTWTKACAMRLMIANPDPTYELPLLACLFHRNPLLCSLANGYAEKNGKATKLIQHKKELGFTIKHSEPDGDVLYENITALKKNLFFQKAAYNDLIELAESMNINNSIGLQKIAGHDLKKDEPILILEGKIIIEFKEPLPSAAIIKGVIGSNLIHADKIAAVFVYEQTQIRLMSRNAMNHLVFKSNNVSAELFAYNEKVTKGNLLTNT